MKKDRKKYYMFKEHYETIIEPALYRNVFRDRWIFRISMFISLALSISIFWSTTDSLGIVLLKILLAILFWSFAFMIIHVNAHIHMWKNRNSIDQRIFPFYHHYVDVSLYSKHKDNYHAAQLEALAFIVIPMMYIDNVVGTTMFLFGTIDIFTHQWYHTKKEDRKKDFNPFLFWLLSFLERVHVIGTNNHIKVHHTHGLNQLDEVKGWLDVSWPFIGRSCDLLGDIIYKNFKDIKLGSYLVYGILAGMYILMWIFITPLSYNALNLQVVLLHIIVLTFMLYMGLCK